MDSLFQMMHVNPVLLVVKFVQHQSVLLVWMAGTRLQTIPALSVQDYARHAQAIKIIVILAIQDISSVLWLVEVKLV